MPHTIDLTVIIVSLGTVLLNGIFSLLSRKYSSSARTHADRAVQASLKPRNNETEIKLDSPFDYCDHCGHSRFLHNPHCSTCNCMSFTP